MALVNIARPRSYEDADAIVTHERMLKSQPSQLDRCLKTVSGLLYNCPVGLGRLVFFPPLEILKYVIETALRS